MQKVYKYLVPCTLCFYGAAPAARALCASQLSSLYSILYIVDVYLILGYVTTYGVLVAPVFSPRATFTQYDYCGVLSQNHAAYIPIPILYLHVWSFTLCLIVSLTRFFYSYVRHIIRQFQVS